MLISLPSRSLPLSFSLPLFPFSLTQGRKIGNHPNDDNFCRTDVLRAYNCERVARSCSSSSSSSSSSSEIRRVVFTIESSDR